MSLNISEINLQNNLLEQKNVLTSVETLISSDLQLKTSEGDLVSFSFADKKSLLESLDQSQIDNGDTLQEFSSIAQAIASYSLVVKGDLHGEELDAINNLAKEVAPLVREFLASGELKLEDLINTLSDNLGLLLQLELSLERTMVTVFEAQGFELFAEETDEATNIKSLPNQLSGIEANRIRDFPALIHATIGAVFKSEAIQVPVQDSIPKSLSDLLAYIRDCLGEFFNTQNGLNVLAVDSALFPDEVVDAELPVFSSKSPPFQLKK
jgi:hypothetical protein